MKQTENVFQMLPGVLLPWYQKNKRDLPWREDADPYHIWLSEIMLQQTRVEAVKGYYSAFLRALPNIDALSKADDALLHKLWEGLGYYSRVRNLKKAAQIIMSDHGGRMPRDHGAVRKLPGIGPYTAGAVCSIAFGMKTPAVDGNVLRVISRLTDDDTPVDRPSYKTFVQQQLEKIYPEQAGDFTQALMELGATVCGPNKKPDCPKCPCRGFCIGRMSGRAEQLPARSPKKDRREEAYTVFLLSCEGKYALRKRPNKGLLAGLWEFPNAPGKLDTDAIIEQVEHMGLNAKEILRTVERKHVFTHVQWDMRGAYLETAEMGGDFTWLTPAEISGQAALPTAFRIFWDEIKHI